jgi:flagellar biosynthesis/type III secretory pathway M-ring protein FliF/YscJ
VEKRDDKTGRIEAVFSAPGKDELDEWPGLIARAAGLSDAANDKIKVVSMRPARLDVFPGTGAEEPWSRVASYWPAARIAGIMLLATFSLFLLYGLGKRAATNRPVAAAMQPSGSAQNDKNLGLPANETEDMQLHEVQKRLRAFVEQDPRKVAGLVKRWLVREG